MSTTSELCRRLVEINKLWHYYLIDKLIRFILTLSFLLPPQSEHFQQYNMLKLCFAIK